MTKEQEVMLALNPYVYIKAEDLRKQFGELWINNRRYNLQTREWEYEEVDKDRNRLYSWQLTERYKGVGCTLDLYVGDAYFDQDFKTPSFCISEIK